MDSNTFTLLGLRIYGKKSNYIIVNKFAFIFPDKKEQKEIVSILSTFSDCIESEKQKNPSSKSSKKSHVKITDR